VRLSFISHRFFFPHPMKKLFIIYLLFPLLTSGQTPDGQSLVDTARIGAVIRTTAGLSQDVKELKVRTDTLTKRVDKVLKPETGVFFQPKLGRGESWLVAMPLLLFIAASLYVLVRLRREGYRISDALKENYTVDVAKTPEAFTAQLDVQKELKSEEAVTASLNSATDTPATQIRPQSTSRLIVFFSGMAAIIISISAITFFFYVYLRTGKEPEFENLWNIMLGLGVGVVPYAFNRISDAITPPKSAS
jgi:hypothetical protein